MSTKFDWNTLPDMDSSPAVGEANIAPQPEASANFWNQFKGDSPKKEGIVKKTGRYAAQPLIGAAELTVPGIITNAWETLGTAEALEEFQKFEGGFREEELRKKHPTAPWPKEKVFDKDRYLEALETASKTIPTASNIASFIESQTGLPLEAKTKGQRLLRLAGGAGKARPGGAASKVTSAVVAPTVSATLQAMGVPEGLANFGGFTTSMFTPTPKISKVTKDSGLTTRWYEKLKKETKLSPEQYSKVKEAVEGDVKSLTNKLITSESKTARAIEAFPDFNEKISNAFDRVSELSESYKGKIPNHQIKNTYRKMINSREIKGISPDEFERAYLKEAKTIHKSIKDYEGGTVKNLVDQYRKNNTSFGELYEPGKSGALNRAKREALLDYNRALADTFEKKFPDSEFNKLFKFTNKRHMERMNLESIDGFFDKIFGEKINYKEARKFFDEPKIKTSFKHTLGEKGYKDMRGIMKDFMSTEQSMKLIKKAESAGFKNMLGYAKKWALSPLWAKGSALKDLGVTARNELLSTPKFRVTWKSALDDFKAGNFAKAEKEFKQLDSMAKKP